MKPDAATETTDEKKRDDKDEVFVEQINELKNPLWIRDESLGKVLALILSHSYDLTLSS